MALLVALAWLAAACKDGKEGGTTAPPRSGEQQEPGRAGNEAMTWERAEEIAREYHLGRGAKKFPFERHPRVKYLFTFSHMRLLVHGGEVLKARGVPELQRYLADLPVEDRKQLLAEDLNLLVRHFEAFPPIKSEEGDPLAYYDGSSAGESGEDQPALAPRLEWSGQQGRYTVYYHVRGQDPDRTEDPDLRELAEWTLSIAAGGELSWSEKRRRYHLARKEFVE